MGNIPPYQLATVGVTSMDRYGVLFLLLVGIFGNVLNIYIFSRSHLRQNTCVLCLLISSLFNIITLIFGAFLRSLIGYDIDLTYNSLVFCKIRSYCTYVSQSASLWLIVVACIDRYFSSSLNINRRRWLNRQRFIWIIFSILSIILLSYSQIFYCVETSIFTDGFCLTKDEICAFIDTSCFLILNSFFPPSLMLGFGAAMLMNIKQSHQRIAHVQSHIGTINRINRRDKQLISMLLLQVTLIVLCMFPVAIIKFYLSITTFQIKSDDQFANEYFAYQVAIVVSYINSSGMFFVYTLRGKLFRNEIIRLFYRFVYYYHRIILRRHLLSTIGFQSTERF